MLSNFSDLGVSDALIKGLVENNIITPTEIQEKAIPFLLKEGTDFIGQAQTGTGKTAAFGLPLLQTVDPTNPKIQALILCPTRELAQQTAKHLFRLVRYYPSKVFIEAVYGGAPIENQVAALRRPTQLLVATPGRLIDLINRKDIDLSEVHTLVLDEADEMFSMGFKDDIEKTLKVTPSEKNIWLFSATMPHAINDMIETHMAPDAYKVNVDIKKVVNRNIEHQYVTCIDVKDKLETLVTFLKTQGNARGIIFCKTKANVESLTKQLVAKNFSAIAIHGDLQQREREKAMRIFKNKGAQMLITTDVSARGIDVEALSYVVHYQLPEQVEYYTHRSGRTARAGKKGVSVSLITDKEIKRLRIIETTLQIKFYKIRRE